MKFLCSNCKAKYQIPDEKIAGRTLKMDCRRCNTPITIRGDQPQQDDVEAAPEEEPRPRAAAPSATSRGGARATGTGTARPLGSSTGGSSVGAHPAASRSSASGRSALGADFRRNIGGGGGAGVGGMAGGAGHTDAPRITPLDQWHVAINDVPVGPMKRDEIARKIAAGAANAESLAWREGFDDWRPIREIPELAALLRRATQESERPAARPGVSSRGPAPAPRAPAPRAGAMPSPGNRSPLGAPAASARSTGRSNVVPIGGRLGASAAPSFDLEDGDELGGEGETTTIASAADLGLGDFGKVDRDDGEIPSPNARKEEPKDRLGSAEHSGHPKKDPIKPAGLMGGRPIPPPAAKPAPMAAPAPAARAAPVAKAAPAPVAKPVSTPAPRPAPVAKPAPVVADDDDFGLPPVVEPSGRSKTPSFAPPPPVEAPLPTPAAPVMLKASAPPPREERRGGLGVGALMGIGFAMAAGGVLMYGVVQRFILAPPPPTTTVVATVATIAPPVTQVQAAVDAVPPPTTADVPPTTDVAPPPSAVATTASGTHHPSASTTASGATPPTTRTTGRAPAAEDPRFAQFADDGAGPAPIATAPTPHRDEDMPSHSTAELTSDQIGSVVRSGQRALTTCWETALRQAGHVDGDVRYNIDITIGTSGRVTSVNARGTAMANLQDCLERGVRRWVFPPSSSETQTTFPLVFSAQQ